MQIVRVMFGNVISYDMDCAELNEMIMVNVMVMMVYGKLVLATQYYLCSCNIHSGHQNQNYINVISIR